MQNRQPTAQPTCVDTQTPSPAGARSRSSGHRGARATAAPSRPRSDASERRRPRAPARGGDLGQRGAQPRREVREISKCVERESRAPTRAARASHAAASRRPRATAPSAHRFAWRSQVTLEAHWPSEAANSFFVAAKIARVAVAHRGVARDPSRRPAGRAAARRCAGRRPRAPHGATHRTRRVDHVAQRVAPNSYRVRR